MTTEPDDNWVIFAKWTLGDITDGEYADFLEARAQREGQELDFGERIIVDRLRERPENRYTDVRPPGWTPADDAR